MSLSKPEISARMVELSNLRRLHTAARKRIGILEQENKELKAHVAILEQTMSAQCTIINDLKLQMEELRKVVFGRKRKKEDHDDIDDTVVAQKIPRTPDSYKRPLPKEADVTETKDHTIDACLSPSLR